MAPLAVIVLQRYPAHRKTMSIVGLIFVIGALVGASFAQTVLQLIFTQGFLYGIGACFMYNPFIYYLDDWFIERKGLAYGIFWSGTGISGAIMPFLMNWALGTYGFRTTLRAWAVLTVCHPHPRVAKNISMLPKDCY